MPTAYEQARSSPQFRKFTSFSTVAAGTESVLRMPLTDAYIRIALRFLVGAADATDAQVAAQVSSVRLQVDSDLKVDATGAELQMIHGFYMGAPGTVVDADKGQLWIHLARPWHRELEGEDGPQWGLLGKRSFDVKFTLAAGATITACELYAETVAGEELGRHICLRNFNYSSGATGQFEINNLPLDPVKALYAIHFNKAAVTTIDKFTLKVENRLEWDNVPLEVINCAQELYRRKPQTGFSHIDFCRRGRHGDALPLVTKDAIIIPNFIVIPNAFKMIAEIAEVA